MCSPSLFLLTYPQGVCYSGFVGENCLWSKMWRSGWFWG